MDTDMRWQQVLNVEVSASHFTIIFSKAIPRRKNTLNILTLQGFSPWEKFEKDYRAGNKAEYSKEKERMAAVLIAKAEKALLPGLSKAIEVKEIGTPLTNLRIPAIIAGRRMGGIRL